MSKSTNKSRWKRLRGKTRKSLEESEVNISESDEDSLKTAINHHREEIEPRGN